MAQDSTPPRTDAPPPRRRWLRRLTWTASAACLLVFLLPTLLAVGPVRAVFLRLATLGQPVRVRCDDVSLGWASPTRLEGLTVTDRQGEPIAHVAYAATPLSLSELLLTARAGTIELRQPQLYIRLNGGRSNLAQLTTSTGGEARHGRRQLQLPNRSLRAAVSGARVDWLDPAKQHSWSIAPLEFRAGLAHDPQRSLPAAFLESGTIFQQVQLSAQMCDDVLKYVAPNLAQVTRAEGEFSLEVDGGHVLLGDLASGQFAGRLKIHHAQVGAGPLVRAIAERLRLPVDMRLDDNSEIEFAMADARVHHAGLRFHLGPLAVRTSGSVGLDQSLDLVAELPFPTHWVGSGPLRDALAGKSLRLPIRGNLKKPKLGLPGGEGGNEEDRLLTALLDAATGDKPIDETALEQRLIEDGVIPAAERLIDALGRLRERRQAVRAAEDEADSDAAGQSTAPEERERLFRRWRNRRAAPPPAPQRESL